MNTRYRKADASSFLALPASRSYRLQSQPIFSVHAKMLQSAEKRRLFRAVSHARVFGVSFARELLKCISIMFRCLPDFILAANDNLGI